MQQNGEDLAGENGEDSAFGSALIDFAQSMRDLADVKDELVSMPVCVCVCLFVFVVCITYVCVRVYVTCVCWC